MSKSDITKETWIFRYSSGGLKPYILLARLDRPIGIWLLLLPGWWAIFLASGGVFSMGLREWKIFALFACGAVVMRAAGCVINDLWDRDLDKKVARTKNRPLASGAVSESGAVVFLAVLLALGCAVLLQMNRFTFLLGVCSLPLIAVYPLMKRITWWPQAFLGLTFNFGTLMGWSAVTGGIEAPTWFLYAGGILWTLGYDTIYAHQDKEDDALAGIRSSALKLGAHSKTGVMVFYMLAWIFIFVGAATAAGGYFWKFVFLFPALLHLLRQAKTWNPDDAQSSLETFKSNKALGFLVLAALA
ncbi:MAG: 4-hydroxybenzoate octaprenyltransferase [Alphaproteobacteria bacterium]|nr:4-hydroxybenzoate octaprenyltransferase [Alphaproteobacteria bacterium]